MGNQSQCMHHEAHEVRIKGNEEDHVVAKKERKVMGAMISKWKWIGLGFGACATAVLSVSSVIVGVMWWIIGNQFVMDAIIKARGQ